MYNKRRFGESRGGYSSGERSFAPVNVGDEIELKIEAVGEKGDGIAKIKGFVIFVPGVKQGETVNVRITKVLRKVGFGEVAGKESVKSDNEESDEKQSYESEETQETSDETSEESEEETEDSEKF